MAFSIRPYRRFPVVCPVTYEHWFREGEGIVWNLSPMGWRLSGSLPLERGDVCSMKIRLAPRQWVAVAAGKVRWVRGEEAGIETLVINELSEARLNAYILERVKAL